MKTKNKIQQIIDNELAGLSGPYIPAAHSCTVLNTIVPDSMDYETHIVLRKIRQKVGGDLSKYVAEKLGYTPDQLCESLSAEQVDAVAMCIYNIEEKKTGTIVADQTGIGKGRVAASIIRYATRIGLKPIFLSEKPNLFSDIYRDLVNIGSEDLRPFIVNGREAKTDIKDKNGNVIYQAPPAPDQERAFKNKKVPGGYDYVVGTYSQFNSVEKKPVKPEFLREIAQDNFLIMDEAHNASGSSNTGNFLQAVVRQTRGVVFLSATYAKRPDNMPIYAMKTSMKEVNMTTDALVEAIQKGGVALQEILSSQLVSEGQMIRREYSFEGVEVNYITLTEKENEHKAIADNITRVLRDVIDFQSRYVNPMIEGMDKIAAAEGKANEVTKGTSKAGVDNMPAFSKVFNVINQMLFSIKAGAVAEKAIQRLKEGKAPVIAFSSTMGAFLESMENDRGLPLSPGDVVSADYKEVLYRALDGVMRYTTVSYDGTRKQNNFNVEDMESEGQAEYYRIRGEIDGASTGICISPIDIIIKTIEDAGYKVAEVTGRKYEIKLNNNLKTGVFQNRKKLNTNDAFRMFNDNEVDVLMINQAGSTGASAQALVTDKVPREKVKQRVMLILQAELDINREVQKRGRIMRTGQVKLPIYDYIISAIPAERRLMMMLQKKLKSLDANTTSNQKESSKILNVEDFLNKYGDQIVTQYLLENPDLNDILDDPCGFKKDNKNGAVIEDASHKVSGRVAVLSTDMQEQFYSEVMHRYNDLVEYLRQVDEYDLEVESLPLESVTLEEQVVITGKGGESVFATDTILETCEVNVLRKPFKKEEVENMINQSLDGKSAEQIQSDLVRDYKAYMDNRQEEDKKKNADKYNILRSKITQEKGYLKLDSPGERQDYVRARTDELTKAEFESENKIEQNRVNLDMAVVRVLKFFKIGRGINYPVVDYDRGSKYSKAIFLGFIIDRKRSNPFALSAIKARIAVSDSTKYVTLTMSGNQGAKLTQIMGASYDLRYSDQNAPLDYWEDWTKESNVNRGKRFIVTGNILQGAADYKGKLISFTTKDGSTRKGIILPEKWEPKGGERGRSNMSVPIIKALPVIKGMDIHDKLSTTNDISIIRTYDGYKITMPKSKAYKPIFTDPDIVKLLENKRDGFEMISNVMVGKMDESGITKLVNLFQERYSLSMELPPEVAEKFIEKNTGSKKDSSVKQAEAEFEIEKKEFENRRQEIKKENNQPVLDPVLARARAKALMLKLRLLKFKAVAGLN